MMQLSVHQSIRGEKPNTLMSFITHDPVRYSNHSLKLAVLNSHAVRPQHRVALTQKSDHGILGISMPGALGPGGPPPCMHWGMTARETRFKNAELH
ncbi:hypothetical protein TSAR_007305 [Trichomalopsis sarcophagae]|uniref:Uncharacterized protein n=1 Tax=Trichomalopsis sarcophagae TaxID=543379 RepID=A0A232FIT8_9HYME|nr:hypothetical protein TSAR_007305 [Trichomalopsis sarcophagae]